MRADWRERFGAFLTATGRSGDTIRTYQSSAGIFMAWCEAQEIPAPEEATVEDVQFWLSERLAVVGRTRVSGDLAALRLFFQWKGKSLPDTLRVKRQKVRPTRPLDQAQIEQLLLACDHDRERLMVLTLASTGLRIAELARLTVEDIDWNDGVILVHGKGSKDRRVAPPDWLMRRLRVFCGDRTGRIWLSHICWSTCSSCKKSFRWDILPDSQATRRRGEARLEKRRILRGGRCPDCNGPVETVQHPLTSNELRKVLYQIAKRAGLDSVHPHRFRATFATEFMDSFGDLQALSFLMGHESVSTTARYAEHSKERRALAYMRELNDSALKWTRSSDRMRLAAGAVAGKPGGPRGLA
ncbi:MAG: tyrosine-type recombinase/integrase [Vicinamibacterales bacterium]